jgi:predicted heme/steroid binding protein
MRNKVILKAPVYTTPLIFIAVNIVVISFFFSFNDIDVPIKPAAKWAVQRIYEIGPIKSSVNYIRSSIGLPSLQSFTKRIKSKPITPEHVDTLLKNARELPVLTKEQLALFDGSRPSKPIYLAILGKIYDVSKGKKHYAPGGGYHFFSGKDATRAFVTGDFSEAGLIDDLGDMSEQELLGILDWIKFYEKDYKVVAIVEGIYYTNDGKPTERLEEVKKQLEKAVEWKEKQVKETEVFPPCNSEWHKDSGGRVWCTTKSGGINREWVGVPRRLFNSATKSYRCACVKNFGPPLASPGSKGNRGDLDNPSLKEYDDCSPTANSCKIHNN